MRVQCAVALAPASPYIRLLKFVEDIGETIALPFASPVALACASFSPDGKTLIAAVASSTTAALRIWNRDSNLSDDWVEGPTPTALPTAKACYDIAFVNDTEFVIVAPSQVWVVAIDRATSALTFTSLDTADRGTSRRITVMPNKRVFYISNGKWNTSAAGLQSTYWNGSAWTGFSNGNFSSYVNDMTPYSEDGCLAHVATGAMLRGLRILPNASPPTVVASGIIQIGTGDAVAYDGVTAGVYNGTIGLSPDKELALVTMFASPWITLRRILDYKTPNYWSDPSGPTFPSISAQVNDMVTIAAGIILLAVASATITTGRVRGWRYNGPEANLTEVDAVSDLFDDWNSTPNYLAVGPVVDDVEAVTNLYNSFVLDILNGDVDFASVKILLVDDDATFVKTHTTLAQVVGSNEVFGSSWPEGGIDVDTLTLTGYGTDGAVALNMSVPSLPMNDPGTITFRSAVIYDDADTDKRPLAFIQFTADQSATQYDQMNFASADGRLLVIEPEA